MTDTNNTIHGVAKFGGDTTSLDDPSWNAALKVAVETIYPNVRFIDPGGVDWNHAVNGLGAVDVSDQVDYEPFWHCDLDELAQIAGL